MPPSWRKAILLALQDNESYLDNVSDDTLQLVVEAIAERVPWFPRVLTIDKKEWVYRELALIREDLSAQKKTHDSSGDS